MSDYVVGIDVGTGSARAGLFALQGRRIASAAEPIKIWRPRPDYVEQSSEDIWKAICRSVHSVLAESGIVKERVTAISFDATCSLVVVDDADAPVTVDIEGDPDRNIIVWMDHRALIETEAINAGDYPVLRYVGGRLSPEMETPKLKWLKSHLPDTWRRAARLFDLADYLTYRACGDDTRSLCTTVCKWTYLGHEGPHGRWDSDYFDRIGLSDALSDGRIGDTVRPMGTRLGTLTPQSALELGLTEQCAVGAGIIDAHAGGLGLLGAVWDSVAEPDLAQLETALALIGGTSNCHMAVSREPKFIDGIWGPYYGAMVPGLWLTEGGQSAAGSAIDHMIASHAAYPALEAEADSTGKTIYELLNAEVERLTTEARVDYGALITRNIHILPDFLGNRSPNADPYARAIVDGLTLDESRSSHALLYYATIQAVAYGTRDIVRAMNEAGYRIDTLFVTGGGTKNPLWLQEHADATGLTLILPGEADAVLLGAAMLAALASGAYPSLPRAMQGMSRRGLVIHPDPRTRAYHDARFAIFCDLYRGQLKRRETMAPF